jgi:hypothetical protein
MIVGGWKLKYKKRAKPRPDQKKFKAYTKRNDNLSDLGYAGYAAYLQSDDWKAIREKKLRAHPSCRVCGKPADQVHHIDYSPEVLLGLFPGLLVCLCDACHGAIEFAPEKRKRTLKEANVELRRLVEAAGVQGWWSNVERTEREMRRKRRDAWIEKANAERKANRAAMKARKARKATKKGGSVPPA